jgi:hypothetical protein
MVVIDQLKRLAELDAFPVEVRVTSFDSGRLRLGFKLEAP